MPDVRMFRSLDGQKSGWLDVWIARNPDEKKSRLSEVQMARCPDGQMARRPNGQKDSWPEVQMARRTVGQKARYLDDYMLYIGYIKQIPKYWCSLGDPSNDLPGPGRSRKSKNNHKGKKGPH